MHSEETERRVRTCIITGLEQSKLTSIAFSALLSINMDSFNENSASMVRLMIDKFIMYAVSKTPCRKEMRQFVGCEPIRSAMYVTYLQTSEQQ